MNGWSPISFPSSLTTHEQYQEACDSAEQRVITTEELYKTVLQALRYDKRKSGSRGRALIRAIPQLGLEAGDRLEPSDALPDVADFDNLAYFPVSATFWSMAKQTWATHRNPLFDARIGINIDILAVDILHTLSLGGLP